MSIPNSSAIDAQLSAFRVHLASEQSRAAFDYFVETAKSDPRYVFAPEGRSVIKRSVRYTVDGKYAYAFIVNKADLLFYYRKPSGRVSDELLQSLLTLGLTAAYAPQRKTPRQEITVRISNMEEARKVVAHCFGQDFEKLNHGANGSNWSDEELKASIAAYREMVQFERDGRPLNKSQIYKDLAATYGRTAKAVEFRMQNISAVLSLLGREWIVGLKPAAHVGTGVASRLESLINEVDGVTASPRVAFEVTVREKLREPPLTPPVGVVAPERTSTTTTSIKRDPSVKAWVLHRAKGVCECCGENAPFESTDGTGFLEVHHLRQMADGGSDRVTNAVALCPNCHRRMHFGKDANAIRLQTLARVTELIAE